MSGTAVESFVTDWEIDERLPFYTRANAGEVLADPASPLGWSLVFERGLLVGWRQGFIDFGVYRESELDTERPPLVGMFGGYFYLNLSHMRLMAIRMGSSPEALDAAFLGKRAGVPAHRPHPGDADPECSAKIAEKMAWAMTAESFPEIDEDQARARAARARRPDLRSLSDAELVAYMRSFLPELATAFHRHDYTALASTVGPAVLGQLLDGIGRADLMLDLLSGYGDVDSAQPSFALWELARTIADSPALSALLDSGADRFLASMPDRLVEFLGQHGCRGPNEWDIHAPSWEARPALVVALLDRLRHAPADASPCPRVERLRARRQAAANEVREALRDDEALLGQFELALRSASVFIPARERTKTTAVTFINEVRMAALELGRRGVEAGRLADAADVMMLLESELDSYAADPAQFTEILVARLADYRALHRLDPPFIIADRVEPLSQWALRDTADAPASSGTVLTGAPGSHGVYEGRVRVIRDVADPSALRPGEVVVAPLLDAAWTPLLMAASAVVADVGATNSHAAVICRELGVPLVVSATGASECLRDGMLVRVDGGSGTVTVLATDSPLDWYDTFLPVNRRLRDVCTHWQVLPDGRPNSHDDEAYDRKIIDELAAVHADVTPVLRALGMTDHLARLEKALGLLSDGDRAWFASPRCDSYHTVWMSLHEELLQALGISRAEDAAREERLTPFVTGLPASPGAASGEIVLSSEQAVAAQGRPVILVTEHTTPADVSGILASAAVLTSGGGFSSHAAVIARGAGVPAVCGAMDLKIDLSAGTVTANGHVLRAGDQISVDGGTGQAFAGVLEIRSRAELPALPDGPAGIGVRANADTPGDVRTAISNGAEGIGLCRTEHQFLGDRLPLLRKALTDPDTFDELVRVQRADFRDLFQATGSLPITVRLLDAPTHEFLPDAAEANPMLGVRGVRQAVRHDELYRAQARALFLAWTDVAFGPPLDVMVPMVSLPEELEWAAKLVRRAADDVAGETGVTVPYRIGSMIETPRAALLADRLAGTAEFLSFGTNDLTQLTYGFSRDDVERQVLPDYQRLGLLQANPFERLDPGGVGALLEIAVAKARSVRPDITLSLCGEQGGDPESIALCVRLGLDYVSCSPARVPEARLAAAR